MELLALCDQRGYPTFYFTVITADNYWPDPQCLLQQTEGATHGVRVQAVINHSHLTDWFFAAKLPQSPNTFCMGPSMPMAVQS